MKKLFMRVLHANLFSRFSKSTVIVLMLSGAIGTSAQAMPVSAIFTNDKGGFGKANVTHVATYNESLFFDVKVDNADGEKFTIIVKDETGTTLYRGSFYDKNFKKRFVLPKNDSRKLTFLVKSETGNKSESFQIKTNTRLVDEVVVKKVI